MNNVNRTLPTLESTLQTLKQNILYSYNWHRIGMIQGFNTEKQTATIQLVDSRTNVNSDGSLSYLQYAPLINVPVIIDMGLKGGITKPINVGDFCLVLFNDRDIDNWYKNGTINQPLATSRSHSLSDGIAYVGLHSSTNPIQDYNNIATEIRYMQSLISVQETLIKIKSNGKIELSNNSQNLLTILTSLVNLIKGLQITDPQSGASIGFNNANTLDVVITNLNNLLQ